jgi:hypothetical protein
MIKVSRLIAPIAATILAGALFASPALAAKAGGGGGGGSPGISSSGRSGSHGGGGGFQGGGRGHSVGNGASMHSMHMSHQGWGRTRTRTARGSNFAFSRGHDRHHNRHHHRHFFGGGFIGGYENDWAYEPDCYLRRVYTRHHHWVLREFCY